MIVGEAPGVHEEDALKPFVGPSGALLNEFLQNAGISREACYVTNVVKHRPPNNDLKRLKEIGHEIEEYLPQLQTEIEQINPNCILAVGNLSLEKLTGCSGITKWRGSILRSLDSRRKVIATIHPANLLPNSPSMLPYSSRAYIQLDFNRAIEESLHNRFEVPQRTLFVCKSAEQLTNYIRQNNRGKVSVDIETYKSIPTCIALAFSKDASISVPLVRQESKYDSVEIPDYEIEEIWRIVSELLSSEVGVIGQNFKFDQERLLNTCHMGVSNFHADVMMMAHTLQPEFPKSLGFLASVYTREPFWKDEGKEFNPGKDKLERLFLYNAKDAAVTFELYEVLSEELKEAGLLDFYFNHVHPQHDLYFDLEDIGFAFNNRRKLELHKEYTIKWKTLQEELNSLAGHPVNVNSYIQMPKLLYDELRYPKRSGTDEDTIIALLANHSKPDAKSNRILELALDIRKIRKALGKDFNSSPDYDDRMRSSYRIGGTETSRSSTTKYNSPVRPEEIGIAAQTVTEHGDFGTEILDCYLATEGYILISADYSQAEARVVALLGEDYELLKLFDTVDIHKLTATMALGLEMNQIGSGERFIGKKTRHGGSYDEGKGVLARSINKDARKYHVGCGKSSTVPCNGQHLTISEYKSGLVLEKFHAFSPNIRGVFHAGIQKCLQKDRTLIDPFGRRRQFFDRMDRELFKEGYATLPQSSVKGALLKAMLRIKKEKPQTRFLRESHDGFVLECKVEEKDEYYSLVPQEMNKPIDFSKCSLSRGLLTIPCEIKSGFDLGHMK